MTRPESVFKWLPSDTIVAHAFGVFIDPIEMSTLVRCICAFPNIDAHDNCINCKRQFVFDHNRLPLPPTETE